MEFGTRSSGLGFLILLLGFVVLEAIWLLWRRKRGYPWQEALASFSVAAIKRALDAATAGIAAGILLWVYSFRVSTQSIDTWGEGLLFFLVLEFFYYWHHRWAHEIRWMWATHSVHHSPEHMNLSVAGRLGWTGLLSGSVLCLTPMAWLGYHPLLILVGLAVSLFYQIWLHTELVGKLGPLEWVFNTPSHHRVHHASNLQYIDKNYGGVLIIFDRMFGTFEEEKEAPRYGLVSPHGSLNPFVIGLYEWWQIGKDAVKARNPKEFFLYLFGRPGWKPDPAEDRECLLEVKSK